MNLVPVDVQDWRWHGQPIHFIGCHSCCFRLATTVGSVRVSTVGCYHPMADSPRKRTLENREVFTDRPDAFYETMVDYGEGWTDQLHWATEEEAEAGHLQVCHNVARGRSFDSGIVRERSA